MKIEYCPEIITPEVWSEPDLLQTMKGSQVKTTENAIGSAKPKKVVKAVKQQSRIIIKRLEDSDDLIIIDSLSPTSSPLDPYTAKLIADIIQTSNKAELVQFAGMLEEAFDDYELRNTWPVINH